MTTDPVEASPIPDEVEVPCPKCGGEGEINNPYYQCRCPECFGTGVAVVEREEITEEEAMLPYDEGTP